MEKDHWRLAYLGCAPQSLDPRVQSGTPVVKRNKKVDQGIRRVLRRHTVHALSPVTLGSFQQNTEK